MLNELETWFYHSSQILQFTVFLRINKQNKRYTIFFSSLTVQESSHPSTSSVEANSFPSRTETGVVEHERTLNDATKIPESTSTRTSRPDLILARKPMEEASPSTLDMINNKPADPHKHAAPSALANSNEQVSQLNRLLVSKKVRTLGNGLLLQLVMFLTFIALSNWHSTILFANKYKNSK